MRIVIVTLGTRGDVQPYIALGEGLKRAGHRVRLATHANFRDFVTSSGLDFSPIVIDPRDILVAHEGPQWLTTTGNSLRSLHRIVRAAAPFVRQVCIDCLSACKEADTIMCSVPGCLVGYHIAEKLRVPFYPAFLQNVTRTRAFPSMLAPILPLGDSYNWLSYSLCDHLLWQTVRPYVNAVRRAVLDLPPMPAEFPLERLWKQHHPHLYGFSSEVVPKPREWGDWVHVTGYWFLDRPEDWQPPADLVDFLDSGPAPVSVGFGSVQIQNPEETTALVLKALARTRQRGILLTGWGGLSQSDLPDSVFKLESIPHDWLFPRMAAVVHHGGAGTTAAALRAGVPSVVIPRFTDQPFWGFRVAQLGVGPRPIPRSQLSVERLADAIQVAVDDKAIKARAAALGRRLQAEDGVAQAVEAFQRHPARPLPARPAKSAATRLHWAL